MNRTASMNRIFRAGAPAVAASLLLAGCSGSNSGSGSGSANISHPSANIQAAQFTTDPAKGPLDSITWSGDYRPPYSLDPLKTADFPEETILSNVCEPLLRTGPDYKLNPGIAASYKQTDGTHLVFELDPRAHFSDGKPVTADDVVFSLKRNLDPSQASNYADGYKYVSDISATGASEITITFNQPNYIFLNEMGDLGAAIVEKAATLKQGQNFGAPGSPVVCSGPYTVDSFDGTNTLVLKKDPNYWDPAHAAKTAKITFKWYQDPKALATALDTGDLSGGFDLPPSTIPTLQHSAGGKLWIGGEGSTTMNVDLLISSLTGGLADARTRQALSLAIDRAGIAKTIYSGAADPLYSVVGPGYWQTAPDAVKSVYQSAYDKLKSTPDLTKAAGLVNAAGAKGKTVKIAYTADGSTFSQMAQVIQQAGKAIGLDLQIVGLPPQQYGNLFTDPKARADYDGFLTLNYLEFPEPQAMFASYAAKDGLQDFSGYTNPAVEAALLKAQGEADPAARAADVVTAQDQISQDLPWIPIVAPRTLMFQNKGVTGAPLTFSFMSSAWAAGVGAP